MPQNINEKVVFAIGPTSDGKGPVMVVGIPKDAWEYMRDGKTHQIDLSKMGIPIRLMLFGCDTHQNGMKVLEEHAKQNNMPYRDERRRDFSFDVCKDKE